MPRSVREPIQVYLTSDERGALDRCATEMGVSRSEVLRRGLEALGGPTGGRAMDTGDGDSEGVAVLTPARAGPGPAPPSLPVAPLAELLNELDEDRAER
jgi:hypothetical protein